MNIYMHTYISLHTYINYIHTCIHTYKHTYIHFMNKNIHDIHTYIKQARMHAAYMAKHTFRTLHTYKTHMSYLHTYIE